MGQLFKFNPDKNLFDSGSFLPGGISPAEAYTLDLGDYNPLSGSSEGGASTGMDPLTAGLGIANLGASIFGGMGARATQANIANAKMAAAADRLKNEVMLAREGAKFGEASKIGGDLRQITSDELAFGRQKRGALFEQGPLRELKLAGDFAQARADLGLRGSEEAKELSRRENKKRLQQTLAQKQGDMMGMFGRIAPINVESLFVWGINHGRRQKSNLQSPQNWEG